MERRTGADGNDGDLRVERLENVSPHVPLREAVFLALKKAILDGSLSPGQVLSENKIADRLSVSRTPVREAIRVLETENLVTFMPGRKVVVSVPTESDVEEVYEIRALVEAEGLRRITADREDLIRELERHIDEAKRLRELGDLRGVAEANGRFHAAIVSALDNRRLERFVGSLHDTIQRFRSYSLTPEWAVGSEEEHRGIIASLKRGDTEDAIRVLRQNLHKPKQELKTRFP